MYNITLRVYEETPFDGEFTNKPHVYTGTVCTPEQVKAKAEDLFWQCVEIEDIDTGTVYVELDVEKDGEYFDSDQSVLDVSVKRTKKPSPYIILGDKSPHIFAVDRKKSRTALLLG